MARRSRPAVPSGPVSLAIGASAATLGAALLARERRARERAERLAAALSETLLNAIDATDPQTGAHVRRVARYALILADAGGANKAVQHEIERVALFHDIGKIHEALFDIIHDRARLTAEDQGAIATHPERGAAVLAPLADFYPDLPAGVLAHHERWDGTGYPHRILGTAIPFPARVVAIADTFDALTHRRRYSRARSLRDALSVIRRARGTQFDPHLVDVFLSPPVLERLERAMRAAEQPAHRVDRRGARVAGGDDSTPNVSFRWRESSLPPRGRSLSEGREPPPPGPTRRRSPR